MGGGGRAAAVPPGAPVLRSETMGLFSPLRALLGLFARDIGIDLGTATTLVYVRGKGIVINEPSVVAISPKKNKVPLAVGAEAKRMVGRTPANIVAIRPLKDGVISDFDITREMLRYFIHKVHEQFGRIPYPRVVIGIPSGVTEVEKMAVHDAAREAGAREAHLIEEPMAAAIGAGLPVTEATASMIIDIGGGTTEVAVISLGGIVVSRSVRIAGDEMDNEVIQYARSNYNLLIGERTAEMVKIAAGSAFPLPEERMVTLRGRDLVTGLPRSLDISSVELREAISTSVSAIVEAVRSTLEETPPELVADLMHHGIALAGGGALLAGLDQRLTQETKMRVYVADDPITCVVRGAGISLEEIDILNQVEVPVQYARPPR